MRRPRDNLDEALRAVMAGDLDALTPEQVARLESVLNDEPAVADRLAGQIAAPDRCLAGVLRESEQAEMPRAAAWEAAWERIDAPGAITRFVEKRGGVARILRRWRPLAAVAAGLIMAALWRISTAAPVRPWPMQLAADVEINALEVTGETTPFVVSTGDEGDVQVIWVLPDHS